MARLLPDICVGETLEGEGNSMEAILWLLAVILVIGGIVVMVRGAILYGLVLVIVGFLVGPGGVSVFT
jgi:hypothetical protein